MFLLVNAPITCTLFHSISFACYWILCVRGVGCLDHSLQFVCIYPQSGAHLGGLFGCHDRPLCTAGNQH